LIEQLPERWFRIHTLPGGKRLPDEYNEMNEVLWRNNVVASAVLGIGSHCTVFTLMMDEGLDEIGIGMPCPPQAWDASARREEDFRDLRWAHMPIEWRPKTLDSRVTGLVMANAATFAVVSHATGSVYCPYDGGVDLFLPTAMDVAAAKALFLRWLPDEGADEE
jgi:hypothetical protein